MPVVFTRLSIPVCAVVVAALCLPAVAQQQQQQPSEQKGGSYGNWLPGSKKDKDKDKDDSNTRGVQGAVKTAQDAPAEGAVVQLKNTKSMQVRSFITKSDGVFLFNGLNTNIDYEIRAELKGMQSPVRTISTFDDRKRVIVNLELENKK